MPQTPHLAWIRLEHIQHYQYSGSVRGSQPPQGGMLLPCCFASLTVETQMIPALRNQCRTRERKPGQLVHTTSKEKGYVLETHSSLLFCIGFLVGQ